MLRVLNGGKTKREGSENRRYCRRYLDERGKARSAATRCGGVRSISLKVVI